MKKSSIQEIFASHAGQTAWRTREGSFSYRELESRVRSYATLLDRRGAKSGDRWAVRGWPAFDTFALLLAAYWRRIVLLPLPDRLPLEQQELMMAQAPLQGVLNADMRREEAEATGPMEGDDEALLLGIFTSGSTGLPKAILHSWRSLTSSAWATSEFYGLQPGDSWMLSLDPAHIGGLQIAVRCFLGGGVTWHLAEPKAVAEVLSERSPAFISLVPTQLYRLMEHPEVLQRLRACKAIMLGGAPASLELMQTALARKLPVSVTYGSSETAAQCTALPPGVMPARPGDVGQLLPGWESIHAGESLRLRGPAAAPGYYQQKTFTSLLDREGWLQMPDRILCEGGRLTVLGRADGIFQVAGENVAPVDITQSLEPLRGRADFLALPWHDAEYGTVPVLIVRSVEPPEVDTIVERLKEYLNGVQRPRRIYWHASDDVSKPSRGYYEKALEQGDLPLIWRQDFGRV